MARNQNTNRDGNSWSESQKLAVWKKGTIIPEFSSDTWRRDICGRAMKFTEHGNRNSEYGWEIDHILPVSRCGSDELFNLQPLYWKNNADKADRLDWRCN